MRTRRVSVSARVPAPASRAYALIADYEDGHPRILPRPTFGPLQVERGGYGAGTQIRFTMRVFGITRVCQAEITEPEPGRVLTETEVGGGVVTTFTVDSREGGEAAQVTITTDLPAPTGPLGALQATLAMRLLRCLYHRELRQLAAVVKRQAL